MKERMNQSMKKVMSEEAHSKVPFFSTSDSRARTPLSCALQHRPEDGLARVHTQPNELGSQPFC